ncbi:MAG TPA: flippase [Calditrichia bacterium]|nr:flippase [Calditrichota bacterium]HQU71721.1 flippase [Calditrichia bacterium]HQV30302.1 flippase [Calditrichia bacterium]
MSSAQKVLQNSLILSAGHIIAKIFNLVIVVLLTRRFGSEGFGQYSFVMAFVMIFMFANHLGINTYLVQQIAAGKEQARALFQTGTTIVAFLSVFTLLLINLLARQVHYEAELVTLISIFSLYLYFDAWSRYLISYFRAFEKMQYEAYLYILERFGLLVMTCLVFYSQGSLRQLGILFTLVVAVKALVAFYWLHKYFIPRPWRFRIGGSAAILKAAWPFTLILVFASLTMRIDALMLEAMDSVVAVGIYAAARRLVESLSFFPEMLVAALFPAMAALFQENREKFALNMGEALRLMLMLAIPVMIVLWGISPAVIDLLYNEEFSGAVVPMQWLGVWWGVLGVRYIFYVALNAAGKEKSLAVFSAVVLGINVLLNWILIPSHGPKGAALATVVSEILMVILNIAFLRSFICFGQKKAMLAVMVGGILGAATIYLLGGISWWGQTLAALAVFTAVFLALGGLLPRDLSRMASLYRRLIRR